MNREDYETIQQWLKICRTRDIISLYESVRYGEKTYTDLDVEEIMKWVEGREGGYINIHLFYYT